MKKWFLSCVSLSLSFTPLAAQSGSGRVAFDVVVNDKQAKPVLGLEQQNFTIVDNKQPRQIVSFEAVHDRAGDPGAEIVLVIDEVNTSFQSVAYERGQIKKFLTAEAGKLAHPVSIAYFSDSGMKLGEAPSLDGNALSAEIDQNGNALRTSGRSQGFYGAADRSQFSLKALGELAEYEAKRPGRKIVIWVSPGWALLSGPNIELSKKDQQEIFNTIVAISTQLSQSRITLYSVDPLGTGDSGTFRTFYYEQFLKGVSAPKQVLFGDLALQVLASQSGGRVLNSSNDVAGEIAACARDANAFYVLGFDAVPADGPNEYHAIEVKLDRSGLKAQTRAGYYAQPAQAQTR